MANWEGVDGFSIPVLPLSSNSAASTDRPRLAYPLDYSVPQSGTVINFPAVSRTSSSMTYNIYPVEQCQVMTLPSAGPSRNLETPPPFTFATTTPLATPTAALSTSPSVTFTIAPPPGHPPASVYFPSAAPTSVLVAASPSVPARTPASTLDTLASVVQLLQDPETPCISMVHNFSLLLMYRVLLAFYIFYVPWMFQISHSLYTSFCLTNPLLGLSNLGNLSVLFIVKFSLKFSHPLNIVTIL
jgi:hypothetical protein